MYKDEDIIPENGPARPLFDVYMTWVALAGA